MMYQMEYEPGRISAHGELYSPRLRHQNELRNDAARHVHGNQQEHRHELLSEQPAYCQRIGYQNGREQVQNRAHRAVQHGVPVGAPQARVDENAMVAAQEEALRPPVYAHRQRFARRAQRKHEYVVHRVNGDKGDDRGEEVQNRRAQTAALADAVVDCLRFLGGVHLPCPPYHRPLPVR